MAILLTRADAVNLAASTLLAALVSTAWAALGIKLAMKAATWRLDPGRPG